MKQLSDSVLARLQSGLEIPELEGTRYRIVSCVGRGGMGSVWLADDNVLHRRVAMKVIDLAASSELATMLLQEGRTLARLEHPGIVPVHDAGTLADGRTFYCMKFVEGESLTEHLADKNLPYRLRLLQRIAEPVEFAHAQGFIHRDLKPENIMIGPFGQVLVMDWGIAKFCESELAEDSARQVARVDSGPLTSDRGLIFGTPGYMSPEQANGNPKIDHRTDIFSLGAILRFMLTGSIVGKSPLGRDVVPRPLNAICRKAMASDADARYQSVADLTNDLERYLEGAPVSAYSESLLERAGRLYSRHSTAIVLVAVYLLMRLVFLLFAHR